MAAVTLNTRGLVTHSDGMSQPSGRVLAPGRCGMSAESWKRHIVRQLEHRDRNQDAAFRDLIHFYSQLLEKTNLAKRILSSSIRHSSPDDSTSVSILLHRNNQLRKTTGELAYQVLELQQQIKIKECLLEAQHTRLSEEERRRAGALEARQEKQGRVEQVQEENRLLKMEYDELLERQSGVESRLREEKAREGRLLEDMIHVKRQAAVRMNSRNERRSRVREAKLQKELQTAVRSKVTVDSSSSAPASRCTSPNTEERREREAAEKGHARLFRSASVTSPRILLSSMKELFGRRRRGHSACNLEEELMCPMGVCVSARVPARALHVLEAHEQDINAVRFGSSSDLLATGGTDRVIKLWDVRAGSLNHRATLDGSTGGITGIDFNATESRILAATYDNSALLWQRDESVPKLTLTGHRRKVTAARFSSSPHQALTGSADGSIRLWDLHRAACVKEVKVGSYCSDLVCSHNCIISGHYDCKIRVWDTRTVGCVQELPAPGKVTSLDISFDHRQLLSCCRDHCLQLVDLRMWSKDRMCFRAEGFKCFSDSTKAVLSPDSCFLAAGSADGTVYIWSVSTGDVETRLQNKHSSPVSAVSWSASGEYVVSVDKNRMAVLWSDM